MDRLAVDSENTAHSILVQLQKYLCHFPLEKDRLSAIPTELEGIEKMLSRSNYPAHITASGIAIEHSRILLIHHPYLNKWLQPGGHLDLDEEPASAAIREVHEETGVLGQLHSWHTENNFPIDIDVHYIPENVRKAELEHTHIDFRYLLTKEYQQLPGELKASWLEVDQVEEDSLKLLISKIRSVGIFI